MNLAIVAVITVIGMVSGLVVASLFWAWCGKKSKSRDEPETEEEGWFETDFGLGDIVTHKLGVVDKGVVCDTNEAGHVLVGFTGGGTYAKLWFHAPEFERYIESTELEDAKRLVDGK